MSLILPRCHHAIAVDTFDMIASLFADAAIVQHLSRSGDAAQVFTAA